MKFFERLSRATRSGDRFGAVAVRLGHATPAQVQAALKEQRSRTSSPSDQRRLGMIMVEMGMITSMQLGHILNRSKTDTFQISEDAFRLATRLEILFENGQVYVFSGASKTPPLFDMVNQLAVAMALFGNGPVLLVDGDLEQPTLHELHQLPASPGLGDILLEKTILDAVVRPTAFTGLTLLAAGESGRCPLPLLLSTHVGDLFAEMRRKYKLVLVAAAPVLKSSETGVLAPLADGAVIGAVAGHDSLSSLSRVAEIFTALRVPVLGSVLCE